MAAFHAFLKTEFSEENLEFWLACEEFKKTRSTAKLVSKAHRIFEEFVDVQAPREVSVSWQLPPEGLGAGLEPHLGISSYSNGPPNSDELDPDEKGIVFKEWKPRVCTKGPILGVFLLSA